MPRTPESNRAAQKKWRLSHPGENAKRCKNWYEKNKEKALATSTEWRLNNPEKRKEIVRAWAARNPANGREKKKRYDASKLRSVPSWSEKDAIKIVYEKAVQHGFEVDHVVPLQHQLVCGLHVHANLQLLARSENGSKSNRFWPDMPH